MKYLLILSLLLVMSVGAETVESAQSVTVDGSVHPELIPDSAAIQAIFGAHSNFKTLTNSANTEKLHAKIGFTDADHTLYDAAMQSYFNAKRTGSDAAYVGLLTRLSTDGQAKLKSFVQQEKAHIQYHTQDPVEQEVSQ